jgi:aspartate/methionine/tyrosine aminotransferase
MYCVNGWRVGFCFEYSRQILDKESPLHTYLGIHMNTQSDSFIIITRPGEFYKIFAASYITVDILILPC